MSYIKHKPNIFVYIFSKIPITFKHIGISKANLLEWSMLFKSLWQYFPRAQVEIHWVPTNSKMGKSSLKESVER